MLCGLIELGVLENGGVDAAIQALSNEMGEYEGEDNKGVKRPRRHVPEATLWKLWVDVKDNTDVISHHKALVEEARDAGGLRALIESYVGELDEGYNT